MITEMTWFILVLWICLVAFGRKEQIIGVFGGMVGVFFGLLLLTDSLPLGLILMGLNIYLIYNAIFEGHPK